MKKIYGFPHIIVFLTLLFSLNLISLFFHRSSSFIAPLLSPLLFFHCSSVLSPLLCPFTDPFSFHRSPLLPRLPSPSWLLSPFTTPLSFLATLSFHRSPLLLGHSLLSPLPSPSLLLSPFTALLSFLATLFFHLSPLLLGYSLLSPLPSHFTFPLSIHHIPPIYGYSLLSSLPSILSPLSSPSPLLAPFTARAAINHLFLQNPTIIGCFLPLLKTVDFFRPKSTKIKNSFPGTSLCPVIVINKFPLKSKIRRDWFLNKTINLLN